MFVLLLSVSLTGGCRSKSPDAERDELVLTALAAFKPQAEKDARGRVIDLKLEGDGVTDAAVEEAVKLPELKRLSLFASSVTDTGVAKLAALKKLEALGLGKTNVTRKGLHHLEAMPSLTWLWLTETKNLTPTQIDDFKKKAVPTLTIYR